MADCKCGNPEGRCVSCIADIVAEKIHRKEAITGLEFDVYVADHELAIERAAGYVSRRTAQEHFSQALAHLSMLRKDVIAGGL